MEWLMWAILISPISIFAAYRVLTRKIKISYKISLKAWFGVNIIVFYFSLLLMLVTTRLIIKTNGNEMGVLFIQQGGVVTIVMLLSSWMNKTLVQSADLDYTKGYSPMYIKIHFSLICAAASYVCYLDGKSMEGVLSNPPQYGQAVMWLVVISQIWIGFVNFSVSRINQESPCVRLKEIKGNLRYAYPCIISILIGPISIFVLIYCILEKGFQMPEWMDTISYIFMFETLVFTMVLFVIAMYRIPPKWYDVYRLKKKILKLNTSDVLKGYYRGVKYEITSCEEGCSIVIHKMNIEIDKNNMLTKSEKASLNEFMDVYKFTIKNDEGMIIELLERWAEKKKKIFEGIHKNIKKKYIENVNKYNA